MTTDNIQNVVPMRRKAMTGSRKPLEAIEYHAKAALFFSGGKESVVLAHLMKPWRDRLTLLYVSTGMMFPHMADFVRCFAKEHGYELAEVHSNQAARFAAAGLPSKIIPIHNTRLGMSVEENPKPRLLLTDPHSCCLELRSRPGLEWMRLNGVSALVHGQRAEDMSRPKFADNIAEIAPLWDWSEAQVYAYIKDHCLELPEQYSAGYPDSGECWNCTAEVMDPARFEYMGKRYPELLKQLAPVLADVYGLVGDHLEEMRAGFNAAADGYNAIVKGSADGIPT